MITKEYLKSILDYNQETGIFTWKSRTTLNVNIKIGSIAGHISKDKYVYISINSKSYKSHRLAWLYVYGYFPTVIDHINGNPTDNSISNLRESTITQNNQNSKIRKDNTSGIKGIHWNKELNKWRARIMVNNKRKYLGDFETLELAKSVIEKARLKYHGEFANNG